MCRPLQSSLSALLLCALAAGETVAQGSEPVVTLSVDACVPIDRASLQRILSIELGTSTAQGPVPNAPTRVWVGCSPQGIELRLEDGVTSKSMARTLPAQSFQDPSSTRLLALAVAEFVVASWIELDVRQKPAVEPLAVAPPPSSDARRAVSASLERRVGDSRYETSVSAALWLQLWTGHDAPWIGGNLRLLRTSSAHFAWTLSGDLGVHDSDVALGNITTTSASISLAGLLHARLGAVTLLTGPGARIGLARIDGASDNAARARGREFFAPYGGPTWLTRLALSPTRVLRVALEVEVGYATLPATATASGRRVFALEGLWLTPGLAFGVVL